MRWEIAIPYTFSETSSVLKGAELLTHDFTAFNPGYYPYEYTNPKDELIASREGAWIGCFLNMMPAIDVWAPMRPRCSTTCASTAISQSSR